MVCFKTADFRTPGHAHVLDRKSIENLSSSRLSDGIGQVMVSHEKEDGDLVGCQPVDPFGKLTLLRRRGFPALVGISAKKHQIDCIGKGIVHDLIEGTEKVSESGGKAGGGVGAPVGFDAQMKISEMQDSHGYLMLHENGMPPKGCGLGD
jgi:hypothetical protein